MSLTPSENRRRAPGPAVLLHVTDVLPFTGGRNSPAIQAACRRGTAVHKITEDFDRGQMVIAENEYAGYLAAWRLCLIETGAKIKEIEVGIGGPRFGFVGTADRIVQVGPELFVWDIKTGPPWPTHGLQLAAYEHAYRTEHMPRRKHQLGRACVHLKADGSYKIERKVNVHDLHTFMAYLRVAKWELEHELREPPRERS